MEKKENMRIIISKKMIREGLFRCLKTKKIDKITITELCREAGVNRTTFYSHYEFPRDVLDEISAEIVDEIIDIYKHTDSVRESTILSLVRLQEQKDILKVIFSENVSYSLYDTAIHAFARFWDNVFSLPSKFDENNDAYRLAVTAYGWAGFHMIRQWIMEDIDLSAEELIDLFEKIFADRERSW